MTETHDSTPDTTRKPTPPWTPKESRCKCCGDTFDKHPEDTNPYCSPWCGQYDYGDPTE